MYHISDLWYSCQSSSRIITAVPYAWDEPTHPEVLCLQVKGVSEVKEFDLNSFSDQGKVYYESYFHIVAASRSGGESGSRRLDEFVLDVPQGRAVILTRKVIAIIQRERERLGSYYVISCL